MLLQHGLQGSCPAKAQSAGGRYERERSSSPALATLAHLFLWRPYVLPLVLRVRAQFFLEPLYAPPLPVLSDAVSPPRRLAFRFPLLAEFLSSGSAHRL